MRLIGPKHTLLAAAVLAVAAVPATASARAVPEVSITGDSSSNYAFSPAKVSVGKNDKVRWKWDSNAPHNVTFKKLGEHSATTASGSYKLKFKRPATYKYQCTIHGFKGKVVVG